MAKILFIEDDVNLCKLYDQEFRDLGFEVVTAASGSMGIGSIRNERPDLVVLDVGMPGMDGIEALTKILAIDKSIPIVLNSASPRYRDNYMSWTADAYVVKSGDLTELKDTVWELLRQRGMECPLTMQETG